MTERESYDNSPVLQPVDSRPGAAAFRLWPARSQMIYHIRVWLARDGLALLLFLLASLAAMQVVLFAFNTHIIGGRGDNIQYAYITGRMAQALLQGASPFFDPQLNYPDGLSLMATDVPYLAMLLVAPVTWFAGPITGYNTVMLLAHLLSGYFTYLWIRRITGSQTGGIVAGLAFMLAPFRLLQGVGHLQLVSTYALPLFFWALDSLLRPATGQTATPTPRPAWQRIWLLTGATFLVGSACQYYLFICLITGIVYALLLLLPRPAHLLRRGWQACAGAAAGALLSALPYLANLTGDRLYQPYTLEGVRFWSANPINFVWPALYHPLWGETFQQLSRTAHPDEKTLYIGLAASLLALFALWQHPHLEQGRTVTFTWAGVALAAVIFALGTDLHVNNAPLQPENPVWLPAYYLFHTPVGSLLRVWTRFSIIAIFFVACLGGIGAALLVQQFPRWRWQVAIALVALVTLDLLPGQFNTTTLPPRQIDQWLAQQSGDAAVAFVPTPTQELNYTNMFGSLAHDTSMSAYGHPRHQPLAYQKYAWYATKFPAAEAITGLRDMGFDYLVLNREQFTGTPRPAWDDVEQAITQSPDLQRIAVLDSFLVLTFTDVE